ncbi:hypothetical protein OWR29_15715 [Actinoplanes sp. Pm04-4]|uniref:Uncharacterized protein n=1 Tax=Paractinoplanes pyxinae TaxID=2997416 RepID=A0ABT4AYX6_9ACTN|nr:hypothetical protein [Actinoplanes pyxinae]MCY1139446.1 hypothetical protein [Actinoplanes pyxinae]
MTTPQPPSPENFQRPAAQPGPDAAPAPGDPFIAGPAPVSAEGQVPPQNAVRGKAKPWLIAGVAGAVIGALVVGILWAASSFVGGAGDDDAAQDAAAACGVFERVPDDWKQETVTEENTYQLGGAIALAQAAGQRDQKYRALATQAQQVQQAVVTFDITRVNQLVVDVRNTCNDL